MAAITQALLTSGGTTVDATSFATASITPSANKLVLAAVFAAKTGGSVTPTLSGNGLTWVQVGTDTVSTGVYRTTVFRAMGASPSAGAVTIDFGADTQVRCGWIISEFTNINTSGTNGSGAIVQSVTNTTTTGNSLIVTLAAFGDANNATFGGFGIVSDTPTTVTPGTGFTEIAELNIGADDQFIQTEWRNNNDTTVDASWDGVGGTPGAIGIAVEIKNATSSSSVKTYKGLAVASVKTVKGLAIASRKTKKGLA